MLSHDLNRPAAVCAGAGGGVLQGQWEGWRRNLVVSANRAKTLESCRGDKLQCYRQDGFCL